MRLTELRGTSKENEHKTQQRNSFHWLKVGNYLEKLPFQRKMSFDDFAVFKGDYEPVIA